MTPDWMQLLSHANLGGLSDHEDLLLLMALLPVLLVATIAIVTFAGRHCMLGNTDRDVDIAAPLMTSPAPRERAAICTARCPTPPPPPGT